MLLTPGTRATAPDVRGLRSQGSHKGGTEWPGVGGSAGLSWGSPCSFPTLSERSRQRREHVRVHTRAQVCRCVRRVCTHTRVSTYVCAHAGCTHLCSLASPRSGPSPQPASPARGHAVLTWDGQVLEGHVPEAGTQRRHPVRKGVPGALQVREATGRAHLPGHHRCTERALPAAPGRGCEDKAKRVPSWG